MAEIWLDRMSNIGSRKQLRERKAALFLNWQIELRPGVKVPYLNGVHDHPGQKELHFGSDWQYFTAPWGRRTGKTFSAAGEVLFTASFPKTKIWIAAPNYELCDRVFELVYRAIAIDEIFGPGSVKSARFSKNIRFIELTNGSIIVGKSAESPKSLKGEQIDLLIIDECAFVPEVIFTEYLEPCTLDRKGRVLFISTPRGNNWFKKYYERGDQKETREKGWRSRACPTWDNPFMDKVWLASKKAETSPTIFRREYGGSFEDFEGQIWPMFRDRAIDLQNPHSGGHVYYPHVTELPADLTRYRAIDIGHRHPTCCLWGGVDKKGNVYIYREYYGEGGVLHEEHAKTIRHLTGQERIFDSVISHDSRRKYGTNQEDTQDRSVQDIYEENGIFTNLANFDVQAGIEVVGSYLMASIRPSSDHPSLFISRDCENLRSEISSYIWSESRLDEKKDAAETPRKVRDHAVDALRYMLMGNPIWIAPKAHHQPQAKDPMMDSDAVRYGYVYSRATRIAQQRSRKKKGISGYGFRLGGFGGGFG